MEIANTVNVILKPSANNTAAGVKSPEEHFYYNFNYTNGNIVKSLKVLLKNNTGQSGTKKKKINCSVHCT